MAHLQNMPIWLIHGGADSVIPVDHHSWSMYRALRGFSSASPITWNATRFGHQSAEYGVTRYTEIAGGGHGDWNSLYSSDEVYQWMYAQALVPEPSSWALAASAFGGVLFVARRRRLVPS